MVNKMDDSNTMHCVFLNEEGIAIFTRLYKDLLRDSEIIDCHDIQFASPFYLEAKALFQNNLPFNVRVQSSIHLLIPHNFVKLVVLDKQDIPLGFVQG